MSNADFGIMKAKKNMRQRKDAWILRGIKKAAVVAALVVTAGLSLGVANSHNSHPYKMMEEVYTVQRGDTLWTIAEEYIQRNTYGERYLPEFVQGILQNNEELVKSHGQVEPGQKIKITWWEKNE